MTKDQMKLSEEQSNAVASLNSRGAGVYFITGKAGTGKSTVIRHFIENTWRSVIKTAPTGIAAININGATIHSFFGLPIKPFKPGEYYKIDTDIFDKFDTLIIDEASMVRVDVMTVIEMSLRKSDGKSRPFGGKRIILVGDLSQLPPVVSAKNGDEEFLGTFFQGKRYFFQAPIFDQLKIKVISLEKVFRQEGGDFLSAINNIRAGKRLSSDLYLLNQRLSNNPEDVVRLCTINSIADTVNKTNLDKIESKSKVFYGEKIGQFQGDPPAPIELELKEGAKVMFCANKPGRYMNGELGKVDYFAGSIIFVKKDSGSFVAVEKHEWNQKKYEVSSGDLALTNTGSFVQYPLKLAYAITIHKSQGVTLEKAHIDTGRGCFAHGQLYVALSRVKSYEGLTLERHIRQRDIIYDTIIDSLK